MKRKLSVPVLWIGMTFRGAVLILLVMLASELVLLGLQVSRVSAGEILLYSDMAEKAGVKYAYRGALALMFFWVFYACRASSLTVGRLSSSEIALALWNAAVILGWFAILYAVQILAVLIGYRLFLGAADPALVSGQSLMIACCESPTLHSLLPLMHRKLLAVNLLLYLSLGLSMAADVHSIRHGARFPLMSAVLAANIELLVGQGVLGITLRGSWFHIVFAVFAIAVQTFRLFRSAGEEA